MKILLGIYLSLATALIPTCVLADPIEARDGLEGFGKYAAPGTENQRRGRLAAEAFGNFDSFGRADATASPTPTASPTATPSATPTPSPTRPPSAGQSGGSGSHLAFLNGLLSGAVSQALGGAGLLPGHGGPFGGSGGSSNGWGGPDAHGGTTSDMKYDQEIDYSDKLLKQIGQEEGTQRPGSLQCEVEGGKCKPGPGYFSDSPEGSLLGPGDYVGAAHGRGGQFGDGAYKAIAAKTGASYQSFAKGAAGSQQMLSVLEKAGRGDDINPLTGKKRNVVIFFNCHGGGDYLEGTGGGIYGRQMAQAVIKGGSQTGNKDFSHISIVDGGCMPCRGNNMQSQFESAGAEKSFNYFSGASPNTYAYTSGGSGHLAQQILRGISEKGGGGPVSLLKSDLINAVRRVGNGGYVKRTRS